MANLEDFREAHKAEIKEGIKSAEEELKQLDRRKAELARLIASARAWLGEEVRAEQPDHLTLHAAMRLVLRDHPDGLTPSELRDEIVSRGLYERKDRKPLGTSQLHARTSNYPKLFRKQAGRIALADQ